MPQSSDYTPIWHLIPIHGDLVDLRCVSGVYAERDRALGIADKLPASLVLDMGLVDPGRRVWPFDSFATARAARDAIIKRLFEERAPRHPLSPGPAADAAAVM